MSGFWDGSTAEQFAPAVLELGKALDGRALCVLADSKDLIAQTLAITELRKQVMSKIVAMGCQKLATIVTQAARVMRFTRIANERLMVSATLQHEHSALAG